MTIVAPVREPSVEIVEVRPLEQWRQDLLAAADWLEAHEWCQGWFGCIHVRCAAGALSVVTGGGGTVIKGGSLGHMQRFLSGSLVAWNDTPGRTKAEVIATMRACAMQP